MSDFKLTKIGTYTYGYTKTGNPMQRILLDPSMVAKIKEWDLNKIYIFNPTKVGGDVMGLVHE